MRYALDIRVRNAAIAEALLKHGCTQRALAEMAGVNQSDLAGWATLSEDPYLKDGSGLRERAKKLSEFLGLSDQECFPPELYAHFAHRSRRTVVFQERNLLPLSDARLLPSPEPSPEEELARKELSGEVERALSMLKPRERAVIRMRFGLDGEQKTLEEVGQVLGPISRERVRDIEAKALRHLRHPNMAPRLRRFLGGSNA